MSALPPFARFWMVARKPAGLNSRTAPTQRYSRIGDARDAASALATTNDAPFVILEAVEIIRPGEDHATASLFGGHEPEGAA